MMSQTLWIVSVPNGTSKSEAVFNQLQTPMKEGDLARLYKFDMPALSVGTLDSLMVLSDELIKMNGQVEVRCY